MNNMKAEEFIETKLRISFEEEPGDFNIHALELKSLLIEFAGIHVEEALKQACNKSRVMKRGDFGLYPASVYDGYRVDEDAIRNAYPKENIK